MMAKIDIVHVPYKGGGPAMQGFLGEAGRLVLRHAGVVDQADPGRQGARHRHHRHQARGADARRADRRRVGLSRLRGAQLVRATSGPPSMPKEIVRRLHRGARQGAASRRGARRHATSRASSRSRARRRSSPRYIKREYEPGARWSSRRASRPSNVQRRAPRSCRRACRLPCARFAFGRSAKSIDAVDQRLELAAGEERQAVALEALHRGPRCSARCAACSTRRRA